MKKLIGLMSFLLIALLTGCKEVSYTVFEFDVAGFNSTISVAIITEKSAEEVEPTVNEIKELASFYHKLSDKRDYYYDDNDALITNIYQINKAPAEVHTISEELFGLLELSIEYHDKTNGYFNIALAPVIEVWDEIKYACNDFYSSETPNSDAWWDAYYAVCRKPSDAELEAKRPYTNINDIKLDKTNKTIQMKPGMSLDLGAVAKGYVTNVIHSILKDKFPSYIINSGRSSITLKGTDPRYKDNNDYNIRLTDPSTCYPGLWCMGYFYAIRTTNISIGTSGDYQDNYIVAKDKDFTFENYDLYHHIINPFTLQPERNIRLLTVLIDNPAIADIYSTALFTMTVDQALDLINKTSGAEVIIYDINSNIHKSKDFDKTYKQGSL